ncbi:MAG: DUF4129 domain-containing protein [Defluviitaleaceae bacterium]|nr:DUF4129 domain-containing protein [Defluviitaleaceae bacterium]
MSFHDAMTEVLETSRYDFLTGRRVDIREIIDELIFRFLLWIFDNFSFEFPQGITENAGMITFIFTIIAAVLVVIAAIILVRVYLRSRVEVSHTLEDIFEEMRNHTVSELLQLSDSAENQRVSVRYRYIAAILSLNERDIIVIEPSATNAIILRQIKAAAPEIAADFSKIADGFHLTWFGHKLLSSDDSQKFNLAVNRVVEHA